MRLSRMTLDLRNILWVQVWCWSRRELKRGTKTVGQNHPTDVSSTAACSHKWQLWEGQQKPLWTDEYKPKDLLLLRVTTTYPWHGLASHMLLEL